MHKFNFQEKASKTPTNLILKSKKRSSSQINYQKSSDILTQTNPIYKNNFTQSVNNNHLDFTSISNNKKSKRKKMLLPVKSKEYYNKKTLILDLDETLVHSSFIPFEKNDVIIKVEFESVIYDIYVLIRPGAVEFIKKVAKLFEVIIFTASISKYALPLLDIIDINKNIKYKLTREHCTFLNGIYVKELKKLNRDLNDLIILDNSPMAFSFDNDNGLPIKAWYEDKADKELNKIFKILEFLSKVKDVRNFIKKFVDNNEINYDAANEIIKIHNVTIKDLISTKYNKEFKTKEKVGEKEKETEKENQIIAVNLKRNYLSQTKRTISDNNKENNNINVKTEDKLMKNNSKPVKHAFINNKIYTPNYLKKYNDNVEKSFNHYFENYNSSKINKNRNIIQKKKNNNNKNRENNINSIIQNQKKKNAFRTGSWLEKINNKNTFNTNNNNLKQSNIFPLNKVKTNNNNNDISPIIYSTLSKTTKDLSPKKGKKLAYNFDFENHQNLLNNNNENLLIKNRISSSKKSSFNFDKKYTTLLEKLEKKTIKTNYSFIYKNRLRSTSSKMTNNKTIIKSRLISTQNNTKRKLSHVGSYVLNQYKGLSISNPMNTDNKSNFKNMVIRSKSSENLINFYNNIKNPNSTKGHYNFEKNLLLSENRDNNKYLNKKSINLFGDNPKTSMHKENLIYLINDVYKNNI